MGFLDNDDFDARKIEVKEQEFKPVPPAWYDLKIHSVEFRPTKNNGEQLKIRFDIVGPEYQGRTIFCGITTANENEKAVQIGMEQYAALCQAIGKPTVRKKNIQELVGSVVKGRMTIRKQEGYDDQNEVRNFAKSELSSAPSFGGASSAPSAPSGGAFPEFLKR